MAHPPEYYLRRMWFDSVVHSPSVARSLIDTLGADRLVTGSDYPFDMGTTQPRLTLIDAIPGLTDRATSRGPHRQRHHPAGQPRPPVDHVPATPPED